MPKIDVLKKDILRNFPGRLRKVSLRYTLSHIPKNFKEERTSKYPGSLFGYLGSRKGAGIKMIKENVYAGGIHENLFAPVLKNLKNKGGKS